MAQCQQGLQCRKVKVEICLKGALKGFITNNAVTSPLVRVRSHPHCREQKHKRGIA